MYRLCNGCTDYKIDVQTIQSTPGLKLLRVTLRISYRRLPDYYTNYLNIYTNRLNMYRLFTTQIVAICIEYIIDIQTIQSI